MPADGIALSNRPAIGSGVPATAGVGFGWRDPRQLARFVVGELQCLGDELGSRDWTLLLILKIVEPRHELRSAMWLTVHYPKAGARHRDDDILVPHLDA